MSFPMPGSDHPLYKAVDTLLARGMSRRRTKRLKKLFDKHSLPLPVDFAMALEEAGIPL